MTPIVDHSVCYKIVWLEEFEVSVMLHKHPGFGNRWVLSCPEFGIYVFDLRTKDFDEAESRIAQKLYRVALRRTQQEAQILSALKGVMDSLNCGEELVNGEV